MILYYGPFLFGNIQVLKDSILPDSIIVGTYSLSLHKDKTCSNTFTQSVGVSITTCQYMGIKDS